MPTVQSIAHAESYRQALIPWIASSAITPTTIALNSDYVYGTRGNCYFFIFVPPEDGTLTEIHLYVSAHAGTWGSTDGVINIEIRDGLNGSNKPGSSIITGGSTTMTLDGSTGWKSKTGLSISMSGGKLYSILVADADGGATNYVTIQRANDGSGQNIFGRIACPTSTNGFSSGSASGMSATYALKFNSVMHGSGIFSGVASLTSNTAERGVRFKPNDWCTIVGATTIYETIPDNFNTQVIKVYPDSSNPGGSTLINFTRPAHTLNGGTTPISLIFPFPQSSWVTLDPSKWYRLVYDPSSSQTSPKKFTISGSPGGDVLSAAQPFAGDCYFTYESGGAWVDETSSGYMLMPILVPRSSPTIVS